MIRPEAKAQLMRWREVLSGLAVAALGLWWLTRTGVLLRLPGAVLTVGGTALVWVGLQRARFRSDGQGPGSVVVDEAEITYFGPMTGGAVALRDIESITLDPAARPMHWRIGQSGFRELNIPVNAEGADSLFDAFATLPGFKMEKALQARRSPGKHPIVIWKRQLSIAAQGPMH